MDDLRWDDLRCFLAVARSGTLASAASELGVNASTVHRRIAALEQTLEARLFERDPRGYALTQVGEALVPRGEEVEEAILSLRRTATGHDRSAQGPVTLTMPETLVILVAEQLAEVREQCPGLRPILRADDRILDLGADTDIALRPSLTPPPSAIGRKVGTVSLAVYSSVTSETSLPWVVYAAGTGPTAATAWRRRKHAEVPILMEVSSVGAMQGVLAHTPAQGILPCYLGDTHERLVRTQPPIGEAATDLWLLIHADLRRSARVRALVELLVPRLEEMGPLLRGERS